MLKHQFTPVKSRKDSGSVSSGSMDSSETGSLCSNLIEEQERTAREVWDRHTNPASELSMAKRRLNERETKSQSKLYQSEHLTGIKRLEEAAPKHLIKSNVEKEDIYQDMMKAPEHRNLDSKDLPGQITRRQETLLGFDKRQLLVVLVVMFVCLALYSVLLHLTIKAAQCQETLESIMDQRKDWQKKVMEVTQKDKRIS